MHVRASLTITSSLQEQQRFSFSPFLFLKSCSFSSMYTSFSHVPLYCQACHLLISPLPRVRSRVLTLGFVQICSLRGWKVVMRAKKNSLALSLTTRLVFQMKPNENSILYPCYSLPPPHPPSPPSCIPPCPAPLMCRLISVFLSVLV